MVKGSVTAVSTPRKLAYLALGALFVFLGMVGLIVPIIPGVLFLVAAVYVVSKASTRVKRFADADPRIRKVQRRFDRFGSLGAQDRMRLAGWMILDAGLQGVQLLANGISQMTKFVSRRARIS